MVFGFGRKAQPGLFITGTDTGVGKTYVGVMIVRSLRAAGYRVGVYKPVASGCRREGGRWVSDDAVALWEAAGRPGSLEQVCPQCFGEPLAPPVAAREEGRQVDSALLRGGLKVWRDQSDIVVVEGVGGLMSPVSEADLVGDLAADFRFPLVIVARNALGTINHSLLTLLAANAWPNRRSELAGLPVAGLVLNQCHDPAGDPSVASNRRELEARWEDSVLAEVGWRSQRFEPEVDWFALATKRR